MLVLTRKVGEYIQIGDDVRVYLSKIECNRVRMAIDAPDHVEVLRGEIVEQPEQQATTQESTQ